MEETTLRRVMPHSIEAESSVIGSMLMDADAVQIACEELATDDFYDFRCKLVFSAIKELYNAAQAVDPVTLSDKLATMNAPDEVRSAEYLGSLLSVVPTSVNIRQYAKIVKDKSKIRSLIRISEEIAGRGYKNDETPEVLMSDAEKDIFGLLQSQSASGDFTPIKEIAIQALDSIQQSAAYGGGVTGIPTGFSDLDYSTAGLQPSDLILIAARPGMGKTALALNIAEYTAIKKHIPTAIFSLEMPAVQLAKRIISMNSMVDSQNIRNGSLNDDEWRKISESTIMLGESSLIIENATGGLDIDTLRMKCRKLKLEQDIRLVFIDYLQLIGGSGSRMNNSRQAEISEISRALKGLALEINCPIVALSQLSRAVESREDKRPILSDLRESGAIEQDADVVMFLYRDDYYKKEDSEKKGITEVIIGKQRNGPTCTVDLKWLGQYTKFANLARN